MVTLRLRRVFSGFICSFIIILIFLCLQFNLFIDLNAFQNKKYSREYQIIWWTPFITGQRFIQCRDVFCYVTDDKKLSLQTNTAFLFYGTHFNKSDLPLPRSHNIWGLLHEESPRNSPLLNHESILGLFNYSSTFSRYSDFPLTIQYLPSLESLTSIDFFKSFEEKNSFDIAPVIYIQSDCVTPNNRDSYVYELMKYIKVDSYGKCLNNKEIRDSLKDPIPNMMTPDLLNFIGQYKFAIAFENANCDDYITEKLWRPLIVGSIPLYIGSSSVKDWIPNNDSIISPLDFNSPKDLANYLNYVGSKSEIYNTFLKHKLKGKIENEHLIKAHNNYKATVGDSTFIEEFECLICQRLHRPRFGLVNKDHYNCPKPVSVLNLSYNASNWWHDDYEVSKCEANFLRSYIDRGLPINEMKFQCL